MRTVLLSTLLFFALSIGSVEAQIKSNADIKHHNIVSVNADPINGYLEHLPPGYHSNPNKKYPLIVFLHGKGEKGNGSSGIYKAAKLGPPKEVERNGKLCVTVNGQQECFIVISPQTSQGWGANQQRAFWDYILNGPKNYRYDPDRIFLTGLSLGGGGTWTWAQSGDPLASRLSAIAPVCGWGNAGKACDFAQEEIAVWGFHGTADNTVSYNWGKSVYDELLQCNNPGDRDYKWSKLDGKGHAIWNIVYPNDHSEYNPNLYEWFATQYKGQGSSGGNTNPNQAPNVSVSSVNSITLPSNQVSFTANASDNDGWITNYQWSKVSGPSVSMSNTNQSRMTANSLVAGTYQFKVVVTDDDGATSSAFATLTVNGEPVAQGDLNVSAGDDFSLDVSDKSFTTIVTWNSLPDAYVSEIKWTKVSGPAATITQDDKARLIVDNVNVGTYNFKVSVTDSKGRSGTDNVLITVTGTATDPAPEPEPEPAPDPGTGGDFPVDAGNDFQWDASNGDFNIVAKWNLPDAYVTDILWRKISGPSATLKQTKKAKLIVSNPSSGSYTFSVTVTDSKNRVGTDQVTVVVTNGSSGGDTQPASGISVNAGDDFEWDKSDGKFNILAQWDIPDAYVSDIKWRKISGPSATLSQTDKAKLIVDNASIGSYQFEVEITDSKNRKATDRVNVTVIGGSGISVNAGNDFDWNTNNGDFFTLAKWDIPDAFVTDIRWVKISGPWASLQETDKAKLWVRNANKGTYTFKVTITDSKNRVASDEITVTVSDAILTAVSGDLEEEIVAEKRTLVRNFGTSNDQIALVEGANEDLQVQLININGVTLKTEEFNGELNTGVLGSGMYIYTVTDKDGFVVQKGRIIKY